MKIIKVNLGKRGYKVYIGGGLLNTLSFFIKPHNAPVFIVTNRKINSLHGRRLRKSFKSIAKKILFYEVPDSEGAKSFPVYIKTIGALARFSRKSKPLVVAFGGGVVGDLTGFVAATYRRGVPYINIPTTLLAQVDSSIGGKVAIDISKAKNIVGDFYQPKAVISDIGFLETLSEKEMREGLVEIIKYGIIKDRALFFFLEKNLEEILRGNEGVLQHIISRSAAIKARVVEKDEFDNKGIRAILNFGHTMGHAIEAALRYTKSTTHGTAVAYGMLLASFIALRLGMLQKEEHEKIGALIRKTTPRTKLQLRRHKDIFDALDYDKKFIHGTNRFILPKKIGAVKVVENVPEGLIKEALKSE